ncbi:MAG: hypothetical protein EBV41_06840 [Actinobacteria bacterium]|nr:hypothetical protein [Actinomycetota bacterium]
MRAAKPAGQPRRRLQSSPRRHQRRPRRSFAPLAERPQTRERREARARQVCLQCPVLETCRAYAREHREYGFWGGENEEERHTAGFRLIAPVGVRY